MHAAERAAAAAAPRLHRKLADAARDGQLEQARLLLNQGANVNEKSTVVGGSTHVRAGSHMCGRVHTCVDGFTHVWEGSHGSHMCGRARTSVVASGHGMAYGRLG